MGYCGHYLNAWAEMDINGLVDRVANIRSACIELENHKPIQLVMKSVPEAWYMASATVATPTNGTTRRRR